MSAFLAAGVLQPLTQCLLTSADEGLLFHAAAALTSLTSSESSGGGGGQAATAAAMLLAEAGAIPRLMQLVGAADHNLRLAAGGALHSIAEQLVGRQEQPGTGLQAALDAAGGPAAASRLLCAEMEVVQAAGVELVCLLVRCNPGAIAGCVAAGAVPALQQLLSTGEADLPDKAARALRSLATASAEVCLALQQADAGGAAPPADVLPAVVEQQGSPAVPLRCAACPALAPKLLSKLGKMGRIATPAWHVTEQPVLLIKTIDCCSDTTPSGEASGLPASAQPLQASTQHCSVAPAQPQPSQRQRRMCAAEGCGATRGLRRCGGCGSVRYCSEACSRAHWRAHKAGCQRLQAAAKAGGDGGGQA